MIELVIDQRRKDLGGFEVGRVLPWAKRRMVGPFVFFDHMGPADFPPGLSQKVDVRPHPHIGLSTITYLFEGEIMHRDSLGTVQPIRAGEVNWMTAGRGITHSERFEKARLEGDRLHGIQTWVALPDGDEEIAPAFSHYAMEDQPLFEEKGITGRLVAGKAFGTEAKARTHSPMFYTHWALQAGAIGGRTGGLSGTRGVHRDRQRRHRGAVVWFRQDDRVRTGRNDSSVKALEPSTVMLIGGEPIGKRYVEWNFVSSSRERIAQAKADWRAGRMKLPDADDHEFIPLPPDPAPSAEPMS